jgi:MerR family transcriptional regulator/heat shock protein HspR
MSHDRETGVYVISVFAEIAGVHPQTLRNYERSGLLAPHRSPAGSRRFSDKDLEMLRHIQQLTSEGINLQGVRRILELEKRLTDLQELLERTRAQATADADRLTRQYRRDLVPVPTSIHIQHHTHGV